MPANNTLMAFSRKAHLPLWYRINEFEKGIFLCVTWYVRWPIVIVLSHQSFGIDP